MMRALEEFATNMLSEQLKGMFDNANKLLFDMADKAKNNSEQRLYLDTMRVVKLEQPRLLRAFQESLRQAFATMQLEQAAAETDLDDLDNWALQKPDELEEKIVLGNLETKAQEMYRDQLTELEARFQSMSDSTGGEVPPKFMTPGHLFSAFRHTMQALDTDFQIKLVIYRLFEQTVVGHLGEVFTGANRMLSDYGFQPARGDRSTRKGPMPPAGAPGAGAGSPGAAGGGGEMPGMPGMPGMPDAGPAGAAMAGDLGAPFGPGGWPGAAGGQPFSGAAEAFAGALGGDGAAAMPGSNPVWGSGLDYGRLLEALSRHAAGGAPSAVYTDAELAGEMAETLHGLSQGRSVPSWMPAQNLALVGRMFDTLYRDPRLPGPLKPVLGRLQYPVMKAALADPKFFQDPSHPVRGLVRDVFDMLSSARGARPTDVARLEELIDNLLREFDVDPSRFSRTQEALHPVGEADAEAFLLQQTEHLQEHRKQVLQKVRRLVAQELQLRTMGRRIPDPVMPLLLSGFGPMLAVQFLRGGADCTEWKESIELLEQLLDSLVPGSDDELPTDRVARESGIIASITTRLISIGVNEEKTENLVAGLVQAYRELSMLAAVATPPPQAKPEEDAARHLNLARQALSVILMPGCWFKVWDATNEQLRWLKLASHHAEADSVVFTDFSGENHLRIRTLALVNDLLEGRSEPVDPDAVVQKSLKLLGPLAAEAAACKDGPVWMQAQARAADGTG